MLWREHEVRRPEDGVWACCKNSDRLSRLGTRNRERRADAACWLLAASSLRSRFPVPGSHHVKRDPGPFTLSNPVPLRRLRRLRPIDALQGVQQPLRVLADAEEPLLQEALLHRRAAPLARAVD